MEARSIKKDIETVKQMTSSQIALYIDEITQTDICKDKKYCNELIKIFLSKQINQ